MLDGGLFASASRCSNWYGPISFLTRSPELKDTILPIVIGSTVVFEITGPALTRRVINHVKNMEPTLANIEDK